MPGPQPSIRRGSLEDFRENAAHLFRPHWDEVAKKKHLLELHPDWEFYERAEDAGRLVILLAERRGSVVGYSVNLVNQHPHYRHVTIFQQDLLYVHPDERGTRLGQRLMDATEGQARKAGAHLVLTHSKPDTALDRMLPRLGYAIQDHVWAKEV